MSSALWWPDVDESFAVGRHHDDDITLIGSANLDRRSFDLNYENNILFQDKAMTEVMRARQMDYIADSVEIVLDDVNAWSWRRHLWNNTVAVLGPVL